MPARRVIPRRPMPARARRFIFLTLQNISSSLIAGSFAGDFEAIRRDLQRQMFEPRDSRHFTAPAAACRPATKPAPAPIDS